jgi:hypothetical protein
MTPNPFEQLRLLHSVQDPKTAFEDVAAILLFLVRSVSRSPLPGYAFEARANKIEVLNVAGPRESKEPGVYEWTLTVLRFFLSRAVSGAGIHRKSWDTAAVCE